MFEKEEKPERKGEGETMSPSRGTERGTEGSLSVIGGNLVINGSIEEADSIRIEGRVTGDVSATVEVVIGDGGRVEGDIAAPRIVAAGSVSGDLKASDELVLQKTAKVTGDARAPVVVIESGASMNGNLQTGSFFEAAGRSSSARSSSPGSSSSGSSSSSSSSAKGSGDESSKSRSETGKAKEKEGSGAS